MADVVVSASLEKNISGSMPPPPPPPQLPDTGISNKKGFLRTARSSFEPVRLHFAINEENFGKAKWHVERGVDLNFVVHGQTPLLLSLLRERYDIAMLLITSGADVTITEIYPWKRQPVHLAAKSGRVDILEELLHHGASIEAKDGMLFTPLHWAASFGSLDSVRFLIGKGTEIDAIDDRGRTALFRAAASNHSEVVKFLAEHGSDVNIQDIYGWSPLHQAVLCGLPIIEDLLKLGADPNAVDSQGNTPLHLMLMKQTSDCIRKLSNTDLQFYTRELKLTSSCTGHVSHFIVVRDIISMLLDYHADVNIRNKEGHSALDTAAVDGKELICHWLINAGAVISQAVWGVRENWPLTVQSNPVLCALLQQSNIMVPSLKCILKFVIRQNLHSRVGENIQHLPLPPALKQFLQMDFL